VPIASTANAPDPRDSDRSTRSIGDQDTDIENRYVEDAILLPPHGPSVEGRAAIQAWLAALPPISDARGQVEELDGRGDLAYVRGTYSLLITPPGTPAPLRDQGKVIQIYRKQADGSWKLARDIFNSDLPLPTPEPTPATKKCHCLPHLRSRK
jgi:ketosteroid isomerase-like protein